MPRGTLAETEASLFRLFVADASAAYSMMEAEVLSQITRMRLLGIVDDEIMSRLIAEIEQGVGAFGAFKTKISGGVQRLSGQTAQLESNAVFEGLDEVLVWTLDPTVQEHCDTCLSLSTQAARTFAEWEAVGLPGEGNTNCGNYCKCSLEKLERG